MPPSPGSLRRDVDDYEQNEFQEFKKSIRSYVLPTIECLDVSISDNMVKSATKKDNQEEADFLGFCKETRHKDICFHKGMIPKTQTTKGP